MQNATKTELIFIINHNKGFTLIELSIVMVIIGLIIGGILTGRELIFAANNKAIITQVTNYKTAVQTFQMKYQALPGDMVNASRFIAQPSTYVVNCFDGNGDGLILYTYSGTPTTLSNLGHGIDTLLSGFTTSCTLELANFWGHMYLIGLIPSLNSPWQDGSQVYPGADFPYINGSNSMGIVAYGNLSDVKNHLRLGLFSFSPDSGMGAINSNYFSPNAAMYIDNKLDDGMPLSGTVYTTGNNGGMDTKPTYNNSGSISSSKLTGCTVGTSYANAITINKYNTAASNNSPQCQLDMPIQ
ncbi:hypothetical protein SZ25_00019 [Candidatus Arcanobacter lacustris]|uniref:Prepilin-type N-terminal cleavage/methylation domain-containing protein n=1 Tax=Candidatus Arcanibacter lacustris TaxID=1607817 RepID=A0A0F5MPY8_9RICK|nr:hypothetical protein SZ25_00019 [Candidatus Arcanobacter lacustris]